MKSISGGEIFIRWLAPHTPSCTPLYLLHPLYISHPFTLFIPSCISCTSHTSCMHPLHSLHFSCPFHLLHFSCPLHLPSHPSHLVQGLAPLALIAKPHTHSRGVSARAGMRGTRVWPLGVQEKGCNGCDRVQGVWGQSNIGFWIPTTLDCYDLKQLWSQHLVLRCQDHL